MEKYKCKRCGHSLKPAARAGRPLLYCSKRCRRSVEFDLRRIDKLKRFAARLRQAIALGDNDYVLGWGRPVEALRLVEGKLAHLRHQIENDFSEGKCLMEAREF